MVTRNLYLPDCESAPMIRLTVLYNLPPGTDEADFLRWRLTEHQSENESMEGVVYTDFCRIDAEWKPEDGLLHDGARYRFMTIADFTDRAAFDRGFMAPEALAKLRQDIGTIRDAVFMISEVMITSEG